MHVHVQHDYAVVFLTRSGSIQPFTQSLPSSDLIRLLQQSLDSSSGSDGGLCVRESQRATLASLLHDVNKFQSEHRLLTIEFTTIFEYLTVRWYCLLGHPAPVGFSC
jgi:hypothetical protein